MTIKEIEKKLNISRANIRFYEKEGLLEPKRSDNEYRNYSEDDVKRLEKIILFRKCNISIENIRLIFNGIKNIDEVFKEQINVIENEVKQLEGAKMMCKKLAQEKSSIDEIDISKYINIIKEEEQKGNKFYNIVEDYIFATEKLYQSIIENKNYKKGDNMKNKIRIGLYIISFTLTVLLFALFDYVLNENIDWEFIICFSAILIIVNLIGVKKYIENKNGEKFTKKDNIKHFMIMIVIMVVSLLGYFTIKTIYEVYKEPQEQILEMSVKKSLINIANEKFINNDNSGYFESHKIIDYKVKNNKIFVYIVANYGIINKDSCTVKESLKENMTIIYQKDKNNEGIYELKEYKENYIPDDLKDKTNVDYEDNFFKNQINNYCNS